MTGGDALKEQPKKGIILEIGAGGMGASIIDLSLELRRKVENGAPFLVIDKQKSRLRNVQHGAGKKMTMGQFAKSDMEDANVAHMYVGNVFGEMPNLHKSHARARTLFSGLVKKLVPETGEAIIIENYTPSVSQFLTTFPFQELGVEAEIIAGVDEYRAKLKALGISESGLARYFAHLHSESNKPWVPFVIVLRRKAEQTSPETL